mmetsp:Transcript_12162/g.29697  ORF Transcript_12162/g.29697 Transcript_12162/m.29697 type:complete len:364 (+) Transcript_12162:318-1409(+)
MQQCHAKKRKQRHFRLLLTVGQYARRQIRRQTRQAQHGRHPDPSEARIVPPVLSAALRQAKSPRHDVSRRAGPVLPPHVVIQCLHSHDHHGNAFECPSGHAHEVVILADGTVAFLGRQQSQRSLEEIDDLLPQRPNVLAPGDHGPAARQADTPSRVPVSHVDEVLRGRGEEGLEAVASRASTYLADHLLGGGQGRIVVIVVVVISIIGQHRAPRRDGPRVMRTHALPLEERVLEEFHLGAPPIGIIDFGHHGQRLLADHAHPPEVVRKALLVKRVLLLPFLRVVIAPPHPPPIVIPLLDPRVTEALSLRIDRSAAVQTHEALAVIPSLSRQHAIRVDVSRVPRDGLATRVAHERGRRGAGRQL